MDVVVGLLHLVNAAQTTYLNRRVALRCESSLWSLLQYESFAARAACSSHVQANNSSSSLVLYCPRNDVDQRSSVFCSRVPRNKT